MQHQLWRHARIWGWGREGAACPSACRLLGTCRHQSEPAHGGAARLIRPSAPRTTPPRTTPEALTPVSDVLTHHNLDAEPDRSRHGTGPISSLETELDAESGRSRVSGTPRSCASPLLITQGPEQRGRHPGRLRAAPLHHAGPPGRGSTGADRSGPGRERPPARRRTHGRRRDDRRVRLPDHEAPSTRSIGTGGTEHGDDATAMPIGGGAAASSPRR